MKLTRNNKIVIFLIYFFVLLSTMLEYYLGYYNMWHVIVNVLTYILIISTLYVINIKIVIDNLFKNK